MTEFETRVTAVLRALAAGEVVSYGDVAADAGYPKRARAVGHLLATSDESDELPWWRVVAVDGRLVPGHERVHAGLLRSEGVVVRAGKVVRSPYGRFAE